jgi:hypothetical protein
MLIAHMAALGLGAALDFAGDEAFIGHENALELRPQVHTPSSLERIAEVIRGTAESTRSVIDRNLPSSGTGMKERVAIWSRATAMDRATETLQERERILDAAPPELGESLVAALGSPATWLGERPHRGATRLDGVMGNSTSDFVRGVLRRTRVAAESADAARLSSLLADRHSASDVDKTGWAPDGARVDLLWQWLAAIGLTLLPVGLSSTGFARTPCHNGRHPADAIVTLPVLIDPVSIARLRALLQAPELASGDLGVKDAGRLLALGIDEVLRFGVEDHSTSQSVAFSFRPGRSQPLHAATAS